MERQFVGGPPPSDASRQMYQSALPLSRDELDSKNQGFSLDVWFKTRSMTMRMSCLPASSMRRSMSVIVPKDGSIS